MRSMIALYSSLRILLRESCWVAVVGLSYKVAAPPRQSSHQLHYPLSLTIPMSYVPYYYLSGLLGLC